MKRLLSVSEISVTETYKTKACYGCDGCGEIYTDDDVELCDRCDGEGILYEQWYHSCQECNDPIRFYKSPGGWLVYDLLSTIFHPCCAESNLRVVRKNTTRRQSA